MLVQVLAHAQAGHDAPLLRHASQAQVVARVRGLVQQLLPGELHAAAPLGHQAHDGAHGAGFLVRCCVRAFVRSSVRAFERSSV